MKKYGFLFGVILAVVAFVTLAPIYNPPASTGGVWGTITGTLSAQSDLAVALGLKAPLASPAFTGNPTAPTQTDGNNSTRLATTAYADVKQTAAQVQALIDAANPVLGQAVINGSDGAVLFAGGNLRSAVITRTTAGNYTFEFASPLPDAAYTVSVMLDPVAALVPKLSPGSKTGDGFTLIVQDAAFTTATDPIMFDVTVFRMSDMAAP